jgi:peptidyl-tRNA hydrolase, PTH2 family
MVKQVVAIRKDLGMRKGKVAAQAAHASMKVFFDRIEEIYPDARMNKPYKILIEDITPAMKKWIEGNFKKIVVGVNSEKEIYELSDQAKARNIPASIIIDDGLTEFNGEKTVTCIALGPAESDQIDEITKDLSLL